MHLGEVVLVFRSMQEHLLGDLTQGLELKGHDPMPWDDVTNRVWHIVGWHLSRPAPRLIVVEDGMPNVGRAHLLELIEGCSTLGGVSLVHEDDRLGVCYRSADLAQTTAIGKASIAIPRQWKQFCTLT